MKTPIVVIAAVAAGLLAAGLAASPASAQTQPSGGQAFLKAPNAQVGVRPNGAFGSTTVPAGFNNNAGSCLGFVVDRNQTGFGAGAQIDGDFFCPGSPFEGWALSVGSANAINSHSATEINGALSDLTANTATNSVTWTSSAPFNGIAVRQVYSLSNTEQVLRLQVTLTNTTGSSISGINYARIVDPDNQTSSSPFTSTNSIISQAPSALVTASFPGGALVGLSSSDPRAVAAYRDGFASVALQATAVVSGSSWIRTVGSSVTEDQLVALGVAVGTLAAGESTSFSLSYPLTAAAVTPPAPPAPIPTLTEWAMILLGVALAGFAVVTLQRRRSV